MSNLKMYLDVLPPEAQSHLKENWITAIEKREVKCYGCDRPRALELAYRCLYCGLWYCFTCAEDHFGMTYAANLIERQNEIKKTPKQQGTLKVQRTEGCTSVQWKTATSERRAKVRICQSGR